jgi:hypothetical protein
MVKRNVMPPGFTQKNKAMKNTILLISSCVSLTTLAAKNDEITIKPRLKTVIKKYINSLLEDLLISPIRLPKNPLEIKPSSYENKY